MNRIRVHGAARTYQILVIEQFCKVRDDWGKKIVITLILVDKDVSNGCGDGSSFRAGSRVQTGLAKTTIRTRYAVCAAILTCSSGKYFVGRDVVSLPMQAALTFLAPSS